MPKVELEKNIKLEKEDAADLLKEIADSLEDDEVSLKGDGWKVHQKFEDLVPLRLVKDESGLEIGFRLIE